MIISCKPAYKQLLLGNHGNSAYSLVNSLTSGMCFLSPLGFLSPGCLSSVLFSSVSHDTSTKHTSNRPVKGKCCHFCGIAFRQTYYLRQFQYHKIFVVALGEILITLIKITIKQYILTITKHLSKPLYPLHNCHLKFSRKDLD